MNNEEGVWIDSPEGSLFAIINRPEKAITQQTTCIVMLSSGLASTAGPQRFYVKAAREWAKKGLTVIRMDFAGVGYSQAQNNNPIHFDRHRIEEASATIQYALSTLKVDNVFLLGLCAGARAALKCAVTEPEIKGVLSWSSPIISSGEGFPTSPFENKGEMSDWNARDKLKTVSHILTGQKFQNVEWWKRRLVALPTYTMIFLRAIKHLVIPKQVQKEANPFLGAVDQYLAEGRKVLFIFGGRDKVPLGEFGDRFPDIKQSSLEGQGFHVVPEGNHTFGTIQCQQDVIQVTYQWVQEQLK